MASLSPPMSRACCWSRNIRLWKRKMNRGYAAIGLHMPKTPANVGSTLRAAHCYGAAMIVMTGKRYGGAPTDPQKAYRHIPLVQVEDLHEAVPYDCVPVAVDLLAHA